MEGRRANETSSQVRRLSRRQLLRLGAALGLGMGSDLLSQRLAVASPSAVSYWTFIGSSFPNSMKYYAKRAGELKEAKDPNFALDIVSVPYAEYQVKYMSAFATRTNAPDIFSGTLQTYGFGLKVTTPFPVDLARTLDQHVPERLQKLYKKGEEWHALPIESRIGPYLLYNIDHFQEAGLDPKKPPQTMDDLLTYATKLTKRDASGNVTRAGFGLRYTTGPVGIADLWMPFLHGNKGRVYYGKKASGYINSPEAVAALQFPTDMILKHKVSSTIVQPNVEDQFAKGQASIIWRQPWMYGWMKAHAPDIRWAAAPLPVWKVRPGASDFFTNSMMVYRYSRNHDAVWEWLRWINNEKDDLALAEGDGYIPVWKENWANPYMTDRPDFPAIKSILTTPAAPFYDFPGFDEMMTRVGQAVEQAYRGIKTPKAALDETASDLDKLIAKYS